VDNLISDSIIQSPLATPKIMEQNLYLVI